MRDIKTFLRMTNLGDLFPDNRIIDVGKVAQPNPTLKLLIVHFIHLACLNPRVVKS